MAEKKQDSLDMLASLPSQYGYTAIDRYRDFRKVFLTTDEGKRVLRELMAWGRLTSSPILGRPIDPYAMAITFGEANFAKKILTIVNDEPKDRPHQTRKKHE